MGGCLSRPRPRQSSSPALRGGDQPESTECLGPAHTASRVPPACRVHSWAPTLDLARRLSYEGLMASPRRRLHRRGFVLVHRRQYSIQQARCLFWCFFPSVPRSGRPQLLGCTSLLCSPSATLVSSYFPMVWVVHFLILPPFPCGWGPQRLFGAASTLSS